MISFIIGLVGSIMGCVGFFVTGSKALLIIGALLCVVEILLGLFSGQLRTIFPDVLAMVIGGFIAGKKGYLIWSGAAVGLCISTLVLSIVGLIMLIVAGVSMKREEQ